MTQCRPLPIRWEVRYRHEMRVAALGLMVALGGCTGDSSSDDSDSGLATLSGGPTSTGLTTSTDPTTEPGTSADTSASMTSDPTTTDPPTTGSTSSDPDTGTDESTGEPFGCPASAPIDFVQWDAMPWTAPDMGDAQMEFRLSTENWLHYQRFELDLDIDVTDVGLPYNCFLELRNTGAPQGETFPWRYFSICVKNEPPTRMVHVMYAAEEDYLVTPFTLQPNTTYHVNVVVDSILDESTLTMTPEGGADTTIVTSPLTSSITPMGQGLDLWVGFRTSHPDYPTILPPWGWTFRNLHVTMEPGGPYGPLAPGCP